MSTADTTTQEGTNNIRKILLAYKRQILPSLKQTSEDLDYEARVLSGFSDLINSKGAEIFDRNCLPGHITGSALLMNQSFTKVVLTHHKKLNKWLQLGGHADGDSCCAQVALKEAIEESGIQKISPVCPKTLRMIDLDQQLPIDLDIHAIPARKNEPAHFHYDVRFVFVTNESKLKISEESNDLRWFSLQQIYDLTDEPATIRQIDKIRQFVSLNLT